MSQNLESCEQPLRTPPSSNTPKRQASSERKRKREDQPPLLDQSLSKRARGATQEAHTADQHPPTKPASSPANEPYESHQSDHASPNESKSLVDPVGYWALDGDWPQEYLVEEHTMNAPLTKKRSSSTLRDPTPTTSEASNASAKERQYQSPRFEVLLEMAGIFMHENPVEPSQSCKELCARLLEAEQELPRDSLFQEELFKPLITRLEKENEATVVLDMTPLVAPRAELLYLRGARHLNIIHGHVNTAWGRCMPLVNPPPQPDYCVGIDRRAFNAEHNQRLIALICDRERNPLMATWQMYFPFFMCEVKAGMESLDPADRQNMSSGSVAVNTLVAFYRAAGREKELHGKILAFSIAHNTEQFRIYGHYASLKEQVPRFYRWKLKTGLFETQQDKWQAYRFTLNIYDSFVPIHFERVTSVLDSLPENASIWRSELAFQSSEAGESVSIQSSAPRAPESVTTPAADEEILKEPKIARTQK